MRGNGRRIKRKERRRRKRRREERLGQNMSELIRRLIGIGHEILYLGQNVSLQTNSVRAPSIILLHPFTRILYHRNARNHALRIDNINICKRSSSTLSTLSILSIVSSSSSLSSSSTPSSVLFASFASS